MTPSDRSTAGAGGLVQVWLTQAGTRSNAKVLEFGPSEIRALLPEPLAAGPASIEVSHDGGTGGTHDVSASLGIFTRSDRSGHAIEGIV